ncbi:hypothetical protein RchiOBHm_Chr5g0019981 [Rosa chinensis]|uniref:Uncharacterized protein n=1 Tax=Rosa chinensis TaxID=74649 RepID=A0A2P6Q759_ROSCH|nr:hypothetical protein RchiOBHm_Chr5g0019981 [Rosa chinensis]
MSHSTHNLQAPGVHAPPAVQRYNQGPEGRQQLADPFLHHRHEGGFWTGW